MRHRATFDSLGSPRTDRHKFALALAKARTRQRDATPWPRRHRPSSQTAKTETFADASVGADVALGAIIAGSRDRP